MRILFILWITDLDSIDQGHLSWLSLGLLAAQHLGASTAVELLRNAGDHDDDVGSSGDGAVFSAEFYRTCMALSALERKQK